MSELDNLLGSNISLITQHDVRYDGILFSINAKEASLVLSKVKCFGTEDRVTDPSKKIAPNDVIHTFTTFPGHEIKDLYVHEESSPVAPADDVILPTPPPQATASHTTTEQTSATTKSSNDNVVPPVPPRESVEKKDSYYQSRRNGNRQQNENVTASHNNLSHSNGGRGNAQKQTNQHRGGNNNNNATFKDRKIPEDVKGEFDFNAGLSSFSKQALSAEVSAKHLETTKYVKDDFFDAFTSSHDGRLTYSEERKLNQDTFGVSAVRHSYRGGRGRGRGRGGGGRGRGRGGGRNNNEATAAPAAATASAAK